MILSLEEITMLLWALDRKSDLFRGVSALRSKLTEEVLRLAAERNAQALATERWSKPSQTTSRHSTTTANTKCRLRKRRRRSRYDGT